MGNDLAIVNAARTSFLGESKGEEADRELLNYLMEHRHTGPFEQVEFKFRIHAPVLVWWQLVRHRTANLSMQSGRYTELDSFYFPSYWRHQAKDNKQGSEGMIGKKESDALDDMLNEYYDSSLAMYKRALELGAAREMARLFLPGFAIYYTGVWKIDAHNLMNFLELRLSDDAQHEIRQYAQYIYYFFDSILPWTTKAFRKYRLTPRGL